MSEVAVVTGAGSGIGRAIARRLHARGASLALVDIDARSLDALTLELGRQSCLSLVADVADADAMQDVVRRTVDRFGAVDTAVAGAGIEVEGEVMSLALEAWHRAIGVNLTGVFHLARFAVPELARSGRGAFVAVASDSGLAGAQGWPAYAATKHAVVGLIKSMALDHGPDGIRINAVCPGWVQTPLLDRVMSEGVQAKVARRIPMQRLALPDDVAHVVAHLTDEATRHTTGIAYLVDGGEAAGGFHPARMAP